jgi:hypothetical protein
MLHKSELGEHATRFPTDQDGHIPEHGDHWGDMKFDHGPNDPDEQGISDEERARRIEYLDKQWWPQVLADVNAEKGKLDGLPGGNPIKRWSEQVMHDPPEPHGFEVE